MSEHLIKHLRHIQLTWELPLDRLGRLIHSSANELEPFLSLSDAKIAELPTVPSELNGAVPLVNIFKRLQERYPNLEDQQKWLFTKHPDFDEHTPVDVILTSVEHALWISYYLDSASRELKK